MGLLRTRRRLAPPARKLDGPTHEILLAVEQGIEARVGARLGAVVLRADHEVIALLCDVGPQRVVVGLTVHDVDELEPLRGRLPCAHDEVCPALGAPEKLQHRAVLGGHVPAVVLDDISPAAQHPVHDRGLDLGYGQGEVAGEALDLAAADEPRPWRLTLVLELGAVVHDEQRSPGLDGAAPALPGVSTHQRL